MTHDQKLVALRETARLAGRTASDLVDLAVGAVEDIAAPGDVLARETGAAGASFVVLTGEATVARDGVVVARIGPGDLIGDPDVPPTTVRAMTLMHLLVVDLAVLANDAGRVRKGGC